MKEVSEEEAPWDEEQPQEQKPQKKPCPKHPGYMLELRTGQRGEFYSHPLGKDAMGKTVWCNETKAA